MQYIYNRSNRGYYLGTISIYQNTFNSYVFFITSLSSLFFVWLSSGRKRHVFSVLGGFRKLLHISCLSYHSSFKCEIKNADKVQSGAHMALLFISITVRTEKRKSHPAVVYVDNIGYTLSFLFLLQKTLSDES